MREFGVWTIIFGILLLIYIGPTPKYLGQKYWQLGRDYKEGKISKDDKYYRDANFAYLDSLQRKVAIFAILIGIIFLVLSFIF